MIKKPSFNNEGRERLKISLAISFIGIYLGLILTGAFVDFFNESNPLISRLLGMFIVLYGFMSSLVLLLYIMAVMQEYQGAETRKEMDLVWGHKVQTKSFIKVKEELYRRGANLSLVTAFAFPITLLIIWIIPKDLKLTIFQSWGFFVAIIAVIYWLSIFLIKRLYSFRQIKSK